MKLSNVVASAVSGASFWLIVFLILVGITKLFGGSIYDLISVMVLTGALFTGFGVLVSMEEKSK